MTSTTLPAPATRTRPASAPRPLRRPAVRPAPRWQVVLLDDDDHTYAYVMEMLEELFGHGPVDGYRMACEVDAQGRVIVETTTRERAELKRDQIHAYGADWRITRSEGSMSARIEPCDG